MRRALLAITGLATGTVLLVSLKSAPGAARPSGASLLTTPRATAAGTAPAVAPSGQPGAPGSDPAAPPGTPAQSTGAAPPRPATTKPKPPATSTFQVTGDSAVADRFGFVTVRITMSGGRMTDVVAIEMPDREPRSVQLASTAGPVLRQRALQAQSADFDAVSGATYTSEAYKLSLQSALDKAARGVRG